MGLYIEPVDYDDKEKFIHNAEIKGLAQEIKLKHNYKPSNIEDFHLIVCLVDNGFFKALGVAFNDQELEAFNQTSDHRPKKFYLMDKELVKQNTTNFDSYFK